MPHFRITSEPICSTCEYKCGHDQEARERGLLHGQETPPIEDPTGVELEANKTRARKQWAQL
jgi:hypothetical protein